MRIKIRIYNPYDLDIIALSEAPNFSVSNAMRETLKYYAAGKRYLVEIPNLTDHLETDRYVKGFYVELNDEKDQQAIQFIKRVPEGLRNSFMKNIFRASFEVCPMSLYFENGGPEYVAKLIANPRYGRHPVQREIIDPVYLSEGEIGVTLSETTPDANLLPHGETPKKKQKTEKETLRDITQKAYANASAKEEKKRQRRKQKIETETNLETATHTVSQSESDDLDDLLSSIM